MPRLAQSVPKYRKHKASRQAFVELNGRRHYLGPHGSKTSRDEYDRLIGEWLQNRRIVRPSQAETSRTLVVVKQGGAPLSNANGSRRQAQFAVAQQTSTSISRIRASIPSSVSTIFPVNG